MRLKLHNQINETSTQISRHADLDQLHVKFFCHDITFGNGAASLLSTNPNVPIFYHGERKALVYTDKTGRALSDGIYLSSYLLDKNPAYIESIQAYRKKFGFQNLLHIVKRENDKQHFYTFAFDCNQASFQHLAMNNIHHYKHYINHYHKTCHGLIEKASEEKNQIELPYSNKNPLENLQLLFSEKITTDSNTIDLFHHAENRINTERYLSSQQIKCFRYVLQGMTAKEIAFSMNLSHRTIEHYIAAIKIKFKCKNIKELMRYQIT